jgi:single-stranded DNA-binding protein
MFDVLLSGKLRGAPDLRSSRNNNPFATFRLNVPTGKDGGYVQASCITFSQTAIDVMVNLTEGDSVAVTGEAALKTWEGKHGTQVGLDVTVHNAMSTYMVKKKRGTTSETAGDVSSRRGGIRSPAAGRHGASPESSVHVDPPTLPKFSHPGFEQPNIQAPMPDGWDNLDGV